MSYKDKILPGYLTKAHEVQYGQRRSLVLGQFFFHEVDEAYIIVFLLEHLRARAPLPSEHEWQDLQQWRIFAPERSVGWGLGTVSFLLLYQFHILSIPYPFFLVRSLAPFNPSSQFRAVRRPPVSHGETFSRFEDLSDSLSKIGYVLARRCSSPNDKLIARVVDSAQPVISGRRFDCLV